MGKEDVVEDTLTVEAPGDSDQDQSRDDIPDGGVIAWTQVAMGHLVIFNSWGYITS